MGERLQPILEEDMRKFWIAIAMAILLTGCATRLNEAQLASTRKIALVSALGTTFQGVSIGTTVFNNEFFSAEVPQWGLNEHLLHQAKATLQTGRRLEVEILEGVEAPKGPRDEEKIKAMLDAAAQRNFDKVIVFTQGRGDDAFPYLRPNFGFYERSLFGQGSRCVYAVFLASIYDVSSRTSLSSADQGVRCWRGSSNDIQFKARFEDYSDKELATLQERTRQRVTEGIANAFDSIGLVKKPTKP